jgi:hypothetical protein
MKFRQVPMTTTKTSTANVAAVNKPPSLAERVALLLIYTGISAFPLQELFNSFVAMVYGYHELSYQLAFLILVPFILAGDYVVRKVNHYFFVQNLIYRELIGIKEISTYNTEYTIGTYNVITAAANAIYTQSTKPIDTEEKVS